MSIFEKIINGTIKDIAGGLLDEGLGAASEKSFEQFQKRMLKKHANHSHLWMSEERKRAGGIIPRKTKVFSFFDIDGNITYRAESNTHDGKLSIILFDQFDNAIGFVYEIEKNIAPRYAKVRLSIDLRGNRLGEISSTPFSLKEIMTMDALGCKIERSRPGQRRILDQESHILAEATSEVFNYGNITFIDFVPSMDSAVVALLVLSTKLYETIKERGYSSWYGE